MNIIVFFFNRTKYCYSHVFQRSINTILSLDLMIREILYYLKKKSKLNHKL